eukprot:COSAG02_NODE_5889_length_3958_cov_1.680228_3_plen_73_part_00
MLNTTARNRKYRQILNNRHEAVDSENMHVYVSLNEVNKVGARDLERALRRRRATRHASLPCTVRCRGDIPEP